MQHFALHFFVIGKVEDLSNNKKEEEKEKVLAGHIWLEKNWPLCSQDVRTLTSE